MPTIVLSDAHGHPQLITAALEESGFVAGRDRLIFAGDFLDRGPRPGECLELLEAAGAEMLWGNHDDAILRGRTISPQDKRSWGFRERLLRGFESGEWQLVAATHGVLVSHAGITAAVATEAGYLGADALAAGLNAEFRLAVQDHLAGATDATHPLLGDQGPLWLRPLYLSARELPDMPQIAGHTEPDGGFSDDLAELGFHMIDPGAGRLRGGESPWSFRYALVDDDGIQVREGLLPAACQLAAS